mgnify:CR=1 FL=1
MIKKIEQEDFLICVDVIKKSFSTVAKDLNLTNQNAPHSCRSYPYQKRVDKGI